MGHEKDLFKAVQNADIEKVEKLLCQPKSSRSKHTEPIPTTAQLLSQQKTCLITHLNIDWKEEESGYTPLIAAVLKGLQKIVLSLLCHGAKVNETDKKGNTALHLAVFSGRSDLIDILLQYGSEVNTQNSDGNTALHISCQSTSDGQMFILLKLLKAEANALIKNNEGRTPLDIAAMFKRKDSASVLLDHEPAIKNNTLAIVESAIRGDSGTVQILLEHGISPNGIDRKLGTGPLHEAVRYLRFEVAKELLEFGGNSRLVNNKQETPDSLAVQGGTENMAKFKDLFQEYKNITPKTPRYLNQSETYSPKILTPTKSPFTYPKYPLLPSQKSWTQVTSQYCNSCTSQNPNVNIFDGNPKTFWITPKQTDIWCVMDMTSPHTLTGVQVIGWASDQMIQNVSLQRSTSINGPWKSVTTFTCKKKGSSDPLTPGVAQNFDGFCETSQYWRILILNNHGGTCTAFQGVNFYGFDTRVSQFLEQLRMSSYKESWIKEGINCYEKLISLPLESVTSKVANPIEADRLMHALKDIKMKAYPFRQLKWLVMPGSSYTEGDVIDKLVVQADPMVHETLSLFAKGEIEVNGETKITLEPQGEKQPSIATFHNITLGEAGTGKIEIKSVRFPNISVISDKIYVVEKVKSNSEVDAAFDEITNMLLDQTDIRNDEKADEMVAPNEVGAAFEELEDMMKGLQSSLDF
ncbi:unnamed protein product [Owenia fusiformis]|uniref:Uncharacterized protein n=1 Tax=Owenia fusiformis TaxID=6347 RepID=A0A8J1T6F9_OWEFU|nr:unnamed protein product [Owenia fusiformis]